MKKIYHLVFIIYFLFVSAVCFAQNTIAPDKKPEMAVGMRSNGKIYVVVAVVVTILLGLVFYLINLDRKISRLEKESKYR